MHRLRPSLAHAWCVAVLYTAMTIAWTWPLAPRLTTEVASDLGDPLLNCWIMMWTGGQLLRFLGGDWSALAEFWHGNMFYPERLTIAYSEHLIPQMLQALPVFALTGNIVLAYNLLFLSAIVLSGLGMFLLVREFTGQPLAAFVAGLAFAWSPYRVDQFAHLQVISTQWMPLALYGIRRYFTHGGRRALVGATAATVVQGLSCGYFLLFFTPFVAAYCAYELITRRDPLWPRRVLELAGAGLVAGLLIAPALGPYAEFRAVSGQGVRELSEVRAFSADTWSLFTPSEHLTWFGEALVTPIRPEGNLFPGFTTLALGALGVIAVALGAWRQARTVATRPSWRRRVAAWVAAGVTVLLGTAWLWLLIDGGGVLRGPGWRLRITNTVHLSAWSAVWIGLVLAVSPFARRWLRGVPQSAGAFLIGGWLLTSALAWGPLVTAGRKLIGAGPYLLLYRYLPGFDGMRVPSRFAMIAALCLSALAGLGIAALARRRRRTAVVVAVVAVAGIAAESAIRPFITNRPLWVEHFELEPRELASASTLGPVYDAVKAAPAGTVLIEFPYGAAPFDIRTMFFSGFHRKPVVNGYSGFFPKSFLDRIPTIGWDPSENGDAAIRMLHESGATHVVVHEAAYSDDKGPKISAWLRAAGATEVVSSGTDRLFSIR